MKPGGAIVNSTSVQAKVADPGMLIYAATKGAIASLTIGLSNLLAPQGIRVNCVAPGPVWTPIQPIVKSPEQIERSARRRRWAAPASPRSWRRPTCCSPPARAATCRGRSCRSPAACRCTEGPRPGYPAAPWRRNKKDPPRGAAGPSSGLGPRTGCRRRGRSRRGRRRRRPRRRGPAAGRRPGRDRRRHRRRGHRPGRREVAAAADLAAAFLLAGEISPPPPRPSRIVISPRKRWSTTSVVYFSTPELSVHFRV